MVCIGSNNRSYSSRCTPQPFQQNELIKACRKAGVRTVEFGFMGVLTNLQGWIAEKNPCAANVDVTGSSFRLATGITNCDRRSSIEQLKHSQAHFMLTVRNRQSRRCEAGDGAAIRSFQQRLREALQRRIGKEPVETIHHDNKR